MASNSLSLTVPGPSSEVEAAAAALLNDDTSLMNSFYKSNEHLVLGTNSRRAEMEWRVAHLIHAFHPPGLDYLNEGFRKTRYELKMGQWYAHGLRGSDLLTAIDGLHKVLVDFQRDLNATSDILVWGELEDREISLLLHPPLTVADAIARNQQCNQANRGEDIRSVISFLQGHLALLEYARDNSLGILYCVRID